MFAFAYEFMGNSLCDSLKKMFLPTQVSSVYPLAARCLNWGPKSSTVGKHIQTCQCHPDVVLFLCGQANGDLNKE